MGPSAMGRLLWLGLDLDLTYETKNNHPQVAAFKLLCDGRNISSLLESITVKPVIGACSRLDNVTKIQRSLFASDQ